MEKIIAVLTQKGSLSKGLHYNTIINLFKLRNEKVMGVENITLEDPTHNYFSLLMLLKKVTLIYADTLRKDLQSILNDIGVKTKCGDEIVDDKFINQFIFD